MALKSGVRSDRRIWFDGYIRTYLERDLQDLSAVSSLPDLRRLMRAAALRLGQLVNQTELGRVQGLVANLQRLRNDLLGAGSAYLAPLRDSAFLAAVRHRSTIPGGSCEFDLPDFYFWLSQAPDVREAALNKWLAMLRPLCDAIAELLWLTRQGGKSRREVAVQGVFHITFERENPVQLLRVLVPAELGIYPEISGSHYRSSVRFVVWQGPEERPRQAQQDIPFEMICCG